MSLEHEQSGVFDFDDTVKRIHVSKYEVLELIWNPLYGDTAEDNLVERWRRCQVMSEALHRKLRTPYRKPDLEGRAPTAEDVEGAEYDIMATIVFAEISFSELPIIKPLVSSDPKQKPTTPLKTEPINVLT